MSIEDKENQPVKKKENLPQIAVVAAIIFVCVLIMAVLFWVFDVPARLIGVFDNNDANADNAIDNKGGVPNIIYDSQISGNDIVYGQYDINPYDLLVAMNERTSYVQTIRVTTSLLGNKATEIIKITRLGDCYRIENDSRLLIFDGEKLYIEDSLGKIITDNSDFSLELETGLTSLETIKKNVAPDKVIYNISDNERLLIASIPYEENNLVKEYAISLETGVVVSEKTTYNRGVVYRTVETDSIDIFAADNLSDDCFAIPII